MQTMSTVNCAFHKILIMPPPPSFFKQDRMMEMQGILVMVAVCNWKLNLPNYFHNVTSYSSFNADVCVLFGKSF